MAKNDEVAMIAKEALDSAKSAHKRLDVYEKSIDNMHSIALSVEKLAGNVEVFAEKLVNVKDRVDKIECQQLEDMKKPGKLWDSIGSTVITGVFIIIVNTIMTLILK